jgi:ABC-2 type transport system ATP-binding protein
MHHPKVLLLDEPTAGVDPQSRVRLLDMIREQVGLGASVLYTTHYMEEAESICNELAIVDHGKLIASGSLEELRNMVGQRDILRLTGEFDSERIRNALAGVDGLTVLQADVNSLRLEMHEASRHLPRLFDALNSANAEIRETTLTQPSLESLFIKLTGKEMRE